MYRTGADIVEVPEDAIQPCIHLLITIKTLCELQTNKVV